MTLSRKLIWTHDGFKCTTISARRFIVSVSGISTVNSPIDWVHAYLLVLPPFQVEITWCLGRETEVDWLSLIADLEDFTSAPVSLPFILFWARKASRTSLSAAPSTKPLLSEGVAAIWYRSVRRLKKPKMVYIISKTENKSHTSSKSSIPSLWDANWRSNSSDILESSLVINEEKIFRTSWILISIKIQATFRRARI